MIDSIQRRSDYKREDLRLIPAETERPVIQCHDAALRTAGGFRVETS